MDKWDADKPVALQEGGSASATNGRRPLSGGPGYGRAGTMQPATWLYAEIRAASPAPPGSRAQVLGEGTAERGPAGVAVT